MDKKILAIAFMVLLCFSTVQAAELKVFFLDVGEGEAVYLEAPGNKRMLIDSGNLITGHTVVTFLEERGVSEIDALIITHPHPDHMGGIFHILQDIKVKRRYDNGQTLKGSNDIYRWYKELYRRNNYKALKAGDQISEGDVLLEVLWPEALVSDLNTNSLVIKVTYGKTSFLLMGDANIEAERGLLKKGSGLASDAIKIGHHGAGDASSREFLSAVSPKFAVISIDKDNVRGYPDHLVLDRLKDMGIKPLITYRDDNILFMSNGIKIKHMRH
jgi:competence protein ComEC